MSVVRIEKGVRFTPPPLAARLCADWLLRGGGDPPPAVLDPACGDGELLLAAWEASGRDRALAREGLHGIELDPDLAARARERLREGIGGEAGRRAAEHVRGGDALDPGLPWPPGTHVLANPPWVSFSGREAGSLPRARLERYRRDWPTIRSWPSLHGAFLERIARHVAAEGTRARLLLPASVCEAEGYAAGRKLVTSRCFLDAPPVDLGERAFPGILEPAVLLSLRAAGRRSRGSTAPWSTLDPADEPLLAHLAAFPTLPPGSFGDPGVHTGNCAAELVVRGSAPGLPGLREGRDLTPFRLATPSAGLRTDLPRTPQRRFRFAPLERYRAVPILLRQTADRPLAALHTAPTYFRNSLLACLPPPELDPAFVVAVLNSAVAATWHRLRFRDARQRTFPQVKVAHLGTLPFPIVRRDQAPRRHDEIAALARALTDEPHPAPGIRRRLEGCVLDSFRLSREERGRIRARIRAHGTHKWEDSEGFKI